MTHFCCKTRIVSGRGAIEALKTLGAQRLFLVTDPFFAQNGVAERVARQAGAEQVEVFSQVAPDPDVALAAAATARVQTFKPDVLVALGGGSAMDLAKAMVYFSGRKVQLVAIPTTSGSGSEVTDFAILTHDGTKHPLVDPALVPDMAILDDGLLEKLPPNLVADTGFDVLAHCAEAFVAKGAGPVTDALAKEAFRQVLTNLEDSYRGKTEVRLEIHTAATMAGMAFSQAGLGLCHAMAHALGGRFHVAHGRLNAILLPAVISANAYAASSRYAALARAVGLGGSADTVAVRNLKNALVALRKRLGLPESLSEAGVAPRAVWEEKEALVATVLGDPCCKTNPGQVDGAMVRQVLEAVTGRGK